YALLSQLCLQTLKEKRRNLAGRTGCGICGTEQIEQVCQDIPTLPLISQIDLADFSDSLSYLSHVQQVGKQTWCSINCMIVCVISCNDIELAYELSIAYGELFYHNIAY
ncbi:Uncharacterized protein required for formate dehydrogenase activity, partial [Gilliamella apis SCGC AB-598-P17]